MVEYTSDWVYGCSGQAANAAGHATANNSAAGLQAVGMLHPQAVRLLPYA